jgi:hypothetical protein
LNININTWEKYTIYTWNEYCSKAIRILIWSMKKYHISSIYLNKKREQNVYVLPQWRIKNKTIFCPIYRQKISNKLLNKIQYFKGILRYFFYETVHVLLIFLSKPSKTCHKNVDFFLLLKHLLSNNYRCGKMTTSFSGVL